MSAFSGENLTGMNGLLFALLLLERRIVIQVERPSLHVGVGIFFFLFVTVLWEGDGFLVVVIFSN